MRKNPERLAGVILGLSFVTCLAITVSTPLSIHSFLRNATRPQTMLLEVQSGTLQVQNGGRGSFRPLAQGGIEVDQGTVVITDSNSEGSLTLRVPGGTDGEVAFVEIKRGTRLTVERARTPQFSISALPNEIALRLDFGRLRVRLQDAIEESGEVQPALLWLETPQVMARLSAGDYPVEVSIGEPGSQQTQVTVREGHAAALFEGQSVNVLKGSRGVFGPGDRVELRGAERNLLVNGDFRAPLSEGWIAVNDVAFQPPPGEIAIVSDQGRQAAAFVREGQNHAESDLQQRVNYDVRGFTTLRLLFSVKVNSHSLPACGSASSECPLIVRLDYEDKDGNSYQWFHGLYVTDPTADSALNPSYDKIPAAAWHTYASGNLMELVPAPALIKSITLYSSGHSYNTLVTDVELLAQE